MAESVVSYVMQKLGDQLLHEAHLLQGAQAQFEGLQRELKRMQCFLKDADTKQEDARVRNWVSEIRDVAYDVEDLIDTFTLKVKYRNSRGFVKRYVSIFKYWFDIYCVGKEIETIQVRIQEISRSRETYGIRNIGEGMSSASSERLRDLRRISPLGLDKDIVGFKEDTKKLVAQLVKNEDGRSVISIVGMGGLGKTTLAKKIYNHDDVRLHFASRAWVYVSQDCRLRDVLRGILRQISDTSTEEVQRLEVEELEQMVYKNLEAKRYLVVLDDIWKKEDWDCLARAFPNTSNGSRLLLTTRIREVALYADARSIPHDLRLLSKEDGWELFCLKAFSDPLDTSCPPELEHVGREIVEKCGGLPLAIVIIGGLLSRRTQHLLGEWQSVLGSLSLHFAGGQTGASAILDLSYNDLPYYLKSCFLYLAHFPEDYEIRVRTLLQLWIAEGFIPQQGESMERTAEVCLNELIDRNMVQAVRLSVNQRVMSCRIHDLLRELSISKAEEEMFIEIYGNTDLSRGSKTRHLAIHFNGNMYFKSPSSTPHLRSLLVFNPNLGIEIKIICTSFQLLRVLDLENWKVGKVPKEIGKLINLRYLGLRNTGITELPLSMRHLQSLQTLDIRGVQFSKIPNVISKLESLRHLYMSPLLIGGQLKIDSLTHLQTMSEINVLNWKGNDSKMLRNIWKLSVVATESCTDDDLLGLVKSIADLEQLSSLHLRCTLQSLIGGLSSLHRLTKLLIYNKGRLPLASPHEFPQNLIQLTLTSLTLHQIHIEVLAKLPKLSILILRSCRVDQNQLTFFRHGFPQLNFLVLDFLDTLEEFSVEEGAMLRLKRLQIFLCRNLTSLPEGIKSLSGLRELEILAMPQSFKDKLKGVDSYKVQHIPSVIFDGDESEVIPVTLYQLVFLGLSFEKSFHIAEIFIFQYFPTASYPFLTNANCMLSGMEVVFLLSDAIQISSSESDGND